MKIKKFIPNIITLANLCCGFVCIIFFINDRSYFDILILILIAAAFDLLDGLFAKILNSFSNIGKNLDSLADVISFGLVPSIIVYKKLYENNVENIINYAIAFLILSCSAYRLARFNCDDGKKSEFRGLPTPANAIFIASIFSLDHLSNDYNLSLIINNTYFIISIALVSSFLLISNIKMMSLSKIDPKEDKIKIIFILLSIILYLCFNFFSITIIIILFIILSFFKK